MGNAWGNAVVDSTEEVIYEIDDTLSQDDLVAPIGTRFLCHLNEQLINSSHFLCPFREMARLLQRSRNRYVTRKQEMNRFDARFYDSSSVSMRASRSMFRALRLYN